MRTRSISLNSIYFDLHDRYGELDPVVLQLKGEIDRLEFASRDYAQKYRRHQSSGAKFLNSRLKQHGLSLSHLRSANGV
jgi:hypothetical protein